MATTAARGRTQQRVAAPRSRRAHWRALVAAQQRSGLSVAAFCRRRGLRKGTLGFWRWKLARETAAPPPRPTPPAFVPIQLVGARPAPEATPARSAAPAATGEVEIAVGAGRSVRVRGRLDPAWLAQILRVVVALRC